MSLKKDLKEILAEAEAQGWRVELKGGHYKLYAPDGVGLIVAGSTPSDNRALKNLVGRMRKHGFQWKGR